MLRLSLAVAFAVFVAPLALAQTGQEQLVPAGPTGWTARLVPPDTSGVHGAPKPDSSSNNSSAKARHLVPDGGWESDFIIDTDPEAWFSVPIYFEHDYVIEVYVPFSYNNQVITSLDTFVFEANGTTGVSATDERNIQPALDEIGLQGGIRKSLNNFSADRFVRIQVKPFASNPAPAGGLSFHIRVVDLTQVAARWTVNGYNMFIALNNTSRGSVFGFIDYFDQAGNFLTFDSVNLPADGSAQVVHNANVTIGGVLFGGIRYIPTDGAPGAVTVHEYNFNAAIGQYLAFPFSPSPWRTATPAQ